MSNRINYICAQEGLTLEPGVMGTLSTAAAGDMRKAITILQSSAFGSSVDYPEIGF